MEDKIERVLIQMHGAMVIAVAFVVPIPMMWFAEMGGRAHTRQKFRVCWYRFLPVTRFRRNNVADAAAGVGG